MKLFFKPEKNFWKGAKPYSILVICYLLYAVILALFFVNGGIFKPHSPSFIINFGYSLWIPLMYLIIPLMLVFLFIIVLPLKFIGFDLTESCGWSIVPCFSVLGNILFFIFVFIIFVYAFYYFSNERAKKLSKRELNKD